MLRSKFGQAFRLGAMTFGLLMLASFGDGQPAQEKAKTDQAGDPLPPGALARMGTLRWRHSETVSYVAFTPDGKAVLTAAYDSTIRLWDRETGREIRRFDVAQPKQPGVVRPGVVIGWNSYGRGASKIALSKDGKTLAVVLTNNTVQLFDVNTGKEIRQNKGQPVVAINSLIFAPDGKSYATRGYNRITYLFDTQTGNEIRQLKGKQPGAGGIRVVNGQIVSSDGFAFSPDGKQIASAEMESKVENNMQVATIYIRVYEADTGKDVRKIDITGAVNSIAYSPDGKILAFGSGNSVHLREADTGKEIRTIDNGGPIASIVFAPSSKTIAVKRRDSVIRLYETDTGKHTHEVGTSNVQPGANIIFIGAGQPEVRDYSFSADSKVLAMGGAIVVRFFNVATGKELADAGAPAGHRGAVSTVAVSPDGKTLFSRGADNVVRRWDAATGKELGQFVEPKGTIGVTFAPDGKSAALANTDGTIRLVAVADGKQLHSLKGHQNGTAALAFSPDGKLLASRGANDNTIRLFDAVKGGELRQISLPGANAGGGGFAVIGSRYPGATGALVFSADGQTLAANYNVGNANVIRPGGQPQPANPDNAIYQWDVLTGKQIRKITLPGNRIVVNLAFSPDGRVLAAENSDQTLSLWELASGRERAVLGTPPAAAQPGQPVFIGGGGFAVANRFGGATTAPTVAFSPDGALLATRYADHSVRVWEAAHGKEVGTFKGHDGAVNALAFAPDGKRLASASADTTLLVWDLAQLKRTPKAAVELSAKEVEKLWVDLNHDDAVKAAAAIRKLESSPKSATAYLSEKLHPAVPPDVKKIDQWIHDLDSPNFPKRKMASEELEKLGELAVPSLRKLLDGQPTPEVRRRVEPLLEKLTTGVLSMEQIRTVRAIEALEYMGGADARKLLEALAKGAPGALSTRHAQAAYYRHGLPY